MKLRTALTDLVGIDFPVVQAPIGTATCPELAAAVSNAGALGTLALTWHDPEAIRRLLRKTRALTGKPFAVNFVLIADHRERLRVCIEEGVRLYSFFWGDPSPYLPDIHAAGGLAMQTVGSVSEVAGAIRSGIDIIVAQGVEAGGHVSGLNATLALVAGAVDAASGRPVIAAGGIADGRGLVAVLSLGAAGAWMGTRFVASMESAAHASYKQMLVHATADDTVHTGLFDIGWPAAAHRVLRNSTFNAWEQAGRPPAPRRPGEGEVVATLPDGRTLPRYGFAFPRREMQGDLAAMALYAGQSVGLVHEILPAAEIVGRIGAEAGLTLDRLGALAGADRG